MSVNRLKAIAFSCLCVVLNCPAVYAGQFSVSPVSLDIVAPEKAATITVTNNDSRELTVQFRMFAWTQANNEDELVPAVDVAVSPPIAKIPAGAEQVVRIVGMQQNRMGVESAYRLLVDELPVRAESLAPGVVDVLLRYSLPVFFTPGGKGVKAHPRWNVTAQGEELVLHVRNDGARRIRLADVALEMSPGHGERVFGSGLLGYVLAGEERVWRARVSSEHLGNISNPIRLFALTDSGEISVSVPLSMGP